MAGPADGRGALRQLRRKRRRFSSACFFVAGIGFGSAFYILRAHFAAVRENPAALLALIGLTVALFWLGARAESEIGRLDEQIRELDDRAIRRRPRRNTG